MPEFAGAHLLHLVQLRCVLEFYTLWHLIGIQHFIILIYSYIWYLYIIFPLPSSNVSELPLYICRTKTADFDNVASWNDGQRPLYTFNRHPVVTRVNIEYREMTS